MALLDRFRAHPRQKHPDPAVRLASVQEIPLTDHELLTEVAREDPDARVRRAAVAKLLDPRALAVIATSDGDESVRAEAAAMLRDVALEAFEGIGESESLAAVDAIGDLRTLAIVAKSAPRESTAHRALTRTIEHRDQHVLGSIARHAEHESVRRTSLEALDDHLEVLGVVLNSEFREPASSAVERFTDRGELEQIASRPKNQNAAKRERGDGAARGASVDDLASARRQFGVVRREWTDISSGITVDPDLASRYADANTKFTARESTVQEQDQRARRDALARLQQLASRVEALGAREDLTLKAGDRALRDLRSALRAIPPLPSRKDYEEIVKRLKAAQSALTPKVQELRNVADWQRWANVGIQEQLCEKMEALKGLDDPDEIVRHVRDLQQQWRQAADVPRAQGEILWKRFKAAHDEAWSKCEAHFAAQAEARAENLARKLALCERAEALSGSTSWIQTADEIKKLQADWKTIGAVTRGQEKAIWERFRAACDRFFTRRHADLAERKKIWAENLAKKEALCVKAEALSQSTDWGPAAAEIKKLQNEWKAIGPVKKSRSEAIWQRFRTACDAFFTRYAQRHDIAREERVAAREAIVADLEALATPIPDAPAPGAEQIIARVRELRSKWQHELALRGVDRERAAALDARFAAAFSAVIARHPDVFSGPESDPDANRKRMESLVKRMEDLAKSVAGPASDAAEASLSPTTRLAAMLKEALGANASC